MCGEKKYRKDQKEDQGKTRWEDLELKKGFWEGGEREEKKKKKRRQQGGGKGWTGDTVEKVRVLARQTEKGEGGKDEKRYRPTKKESLPFLGNTKPLDEQRDEGGYEGTGRN